MNEIKELEEQIRECIFEIDETKLKTEELLNELYSKILKISQTVFNLKALKGWKL